MLKKYILALFSLCVSSVAVSQQNPLLEKYRSMAVEYSHDLKAADKNIAASLELEKAAQKDLYPKLSGGANFQYTGNPLQLTLDLPSMGNPVTFEGKDMKYGASVSLLQPIYTGGRLLETIRMAKYRHNVSGFQEEYIRSGIYLQTVSRVRTPDRALAKLILIESNGKRTLDEQCDSLGVFLLYKMQIIIERNHRGKYGESI